MVQDSLNIIDKPRGFLYMVSRAKTDILTEMNIDNHHFQVTENPFEKGSCVLWFRDSKCHISFLPIGKFSEFDKLRILNFIVKYSSSPLFRVEIERKKFELKLNTMTPCYFERIEKLKSCNQAAAFRDLFNLDLSIERHDLSKRMKMMVKRFHPDVGGSNHAMAIINEAYQYLSARAAK